MIGPGTGVRVYLACGVAASLAHIAVAPNSLIPSLGASGAILAVLFASVVVNPGASIYILPLPVPIPAPWFALGYLAYSFVASSTHLGRVNHEAHIAGALAGLAFMAVWQPGSLAQALGALLA